MNKLSTDERTRVVAALVEGNSLRAITRMTGVHRTTVLKLLCDLGEACLKFQDAKLRNLSCWRIQCDEIWSFVYTKEKNCTLNMKVSGAGDCWTWVGMDADTKLVCAWLVGGRDPDTAMTFMEDLAGRLATRVQLTTDGHRAYLTAVESAFQGDIDYSMLVKLFGNDPLQGAQTRYSPAQCTGVRKVPVCGSPNPNHISTSFIERQNLTMRMSMRRFTRLTNAFSKKIENHMHAVALHYMHYNFGRVHQTLGKTPAMAAGLSDHPWTIAEIIGLME